MLEQDPGTKKRERETACQAGPGPGGHYGGSCRGEVRGQDMTTVITFEHASYSDPVYITVDGRRYRACVQKTEEVQTAGSGERILHIYLDGVEER